jgi:hypothetical protein
MDVSFDPEIDWNGRALSRRATIKGKQVELWLSREMIHSLTAYNDLVEWEIKRLRFEIFDRFASQLVSSLSS